MKLVGKKIKDQLELDNGFTSLTLDDGTQIITQVVIPAKVADEDDDEEEAPAPKKPEAKKPVVEEEDEDDAPPPPKKKPAPVEEEDDDEEDDSKLKWEDLKGMDEDELQDLIDEENLKTDADDYEDDLPGLRKAIAKEMKIEIPAKKK